MSLGKYISKNIEYIVFFGLVFLLVIMISYRNLDNFLNEPIGINRLDAIIYINLENRNDRKDLLLKELESLDTDMKKIYKVSGVFIPKNGHKGCVQSHIIALKMIKMNKWKRVLILEDDAQLTIPPNQFNNMLDKTLSTLDSKNPEWNVLMLATANKVLSTPTQNIPLEMEISTADGSLHQLSLERITQATTASAYIVNESYVDEILNLFEKCNENMKHDQLSADNYEYWALDQKWFDIQKKDKWFALSKDPVTQRAIWSTTMKESHH